jgi:hypothetical protein
MRTCPYCGIANMDGDLRCARCGYPFYRDFVVQFWVRVVLIIFIPLILCVLIALRLLSFL